jgi:hypothetical protein
VPVPSSDRAALRRSAIIGALGVVGGHPQERFDRITRMAMDLFGVPMSSLNLADAADLHSVSPAPGPARSMPLEDAFCKVPIRTASPLVVNDALGDDRFRTLPPVVGEPRVRFYAGAPITPPGGTAVGSLCIMDTEPRDFDERELALLADLARWAERVLAEGRRTDDARAVAGAFRPEALTIPGWTIDGATTRPDEVAGRFHDWHRTATGAVVTVASISGSPVAATVLGASLRSALRARADQPLGEAVRDVAAQVVPELAATSADARVFTARVDEGTGRVEYVDAGLGLVVHARHDGEQRVVRSRNLPFGLQPTDEPYTTDAVELAPGESLLVGSDGLLRLHDDSLEALVMAGRRLHTVGDFGAFFTQVAEQAAQRSLEQAVTAVALTRRRARHA